MRLIAHAYAFDTDHGLFVQCTPESAWLFWGHEWEYADDVCCNEVEYPKLYILKGLIRRGRPTSEVAQCSESEAAMADLENVFCGWSRDSCLFQSERLLESAGKELIVRDRLLNWRRK